MKFMASCLFGLERLVAEDIASLGYTRTDTLDGHVLFEGGPEAAFYCNVGFRYAERLYIVVGELEAQTFTQLFDGTAALPWEDYIPRLGAFPVKGHSVKSKLFSVPDCQRIIKKAVSSRLGRIYGVTRLEESGIKHQLVFFIINNHAYLMLDTSGEALHKRGYRPQSNAAPLRETLAAALVAFSRPRSDVIFVDPMCGSGTIAIEAALLDRHIAPGISRRFACEDYGFLNNAWLAEAREKARAAVVPASRSIFGSDIDSSCVELARENARRAGVDGDIQLYTADARAFTSPIEGARGTIVCNPPYGQRLGDRAQAAELIRSVGVALAKSVPSWQLYFISDNADFERDFGKTADKKRPLYNGSLRCTLFQYFKPKVPKN